VPHDGGVLEHPSAESVGDPNGQVTEVEVDAALSPADGRLIPPPTQLLSGDEPITGTPGTVQNFWAWAMSDLRGNTVRPMLAEFLVAQALGAASQPRIEWDPYDVVTSDGVTVEVKSSAYLQAWEQARLSSIRFGGLNGRTPASAGGHASAATYNAHVYVFALVDVRDHAAYDPLDVTQWKFWVLPRRIVAATGQRELALSRVQALAGESVSYGGLAAAVGTAAATERA
jgi:hypothetical protein